MDTSARASRPAVPPPRFVTGPVLNHILIMTGAGALGLVAIFVGDLANILFLSWLGDVDVVAAVGYASAVILFTISIGIGLSIAATSVVSPALGAGKRVLARRRATSALLTTFAVSSIVTIILWMTIDGQLDLLGAKGRTRELAGDYLAILIPFLPPLAIGMTATAILRSAGDPRRAMNVTLGGAIVNIALDPIFIFTLGLGIHGAAIASGLARIAIMAIGLYGVIRVHNLAAPARLRPLRSDAAALAKVAIPAVLTNIATPVSSAYVTAAIATFGDSAVAAWAIIGRVMPVAFGAIYALSGSIGPIIGQNYGARNQERMRAILTQSLLVTAGFTALAWLVLAVFADSIVALFQARGEAADLIVFFCRWLAPLFVFLGGLFISNAVFNTLGKAHVPTVLNWGRATIGTIPFVWVGGNLAGAQGVLAANMLGGIVFGVVGVWLCYRLIDAIPAARGWQPMPPENNSTPI